MATMAVLARPTKESRKTWAGGKGWGVRCKEMRGDARRCAEMRGDAGRCGEMRGDATWVSLEPRKGVWPELESRERMHSCHIWQGGAAGAGGGAGRYGEIRSRLEAEEALVDLSPLGARLHILGRRIRRPLRTRQVDEGEAADAAGGGRSAAGGGGGDLEEGDLKDGVRSRRGLVGRSRTCRPREGEGRGGADSALGRPEAGCGGHGEPPRG